MNPQALLLGCILGVLAWVLLAGITFWLVALDGWKLVILVALLWGLYLAGARFLDWFTAREWGYGSSSR